MYRLTVNDAELDVFDSARLAPVIVKQLFSQDELTSSVGDITLNLSLPRTANNDKLLGFAYVPDRPGGAGLLPVLTAKLYSDSTVVLVGNLKIESITDREIKARVIGSNINWTDRLSGLTLRDLDLGCLDFAGLTPAYSGGQTLYEIWQTDEADGLGVQFPLVSYGNFAADPANTNDNPLNNGATNIAESAGLIDGAVLDNRAAWPLSLFDFRPTLYIKYLINKVLRAAGLVPAGGFFTDPYWENLLLAYTSDDDSGPNYATSVLNDASFDFFGLAATPASTLTNVVDNGETLSLLESTVGTPSNKTQVVLYAPNTTGTARVELATSFEMVSGGGTVYHKVRKLGETEWRIEESLTLAAPNSDTLVTIFEVDIQQGDVLELYYNQVLAGAFNVSGGGQAEILNLTACLPLASMAPNLDCQTFLRGVLQHFNLYLDVDQLTGVANLEPRQNYHQGQPIALDLTGRMAVRACSIQIADSAQSIQLNYSREDGEALYAERAYDYTATLGNGYLDAADVRVSIFAATGPRSYVLPTQSISLSLPTLNTLDEFAKALGALGRADEAIKYSYQPRILRWLGLQAVAAATEGLWVQSEEFTGNYPSAGGGLIYPAASFEDGYAGNLDYPTLYTLWFDRSLELSASLLRVKGKVLLYPNEINALNAKSVVTLEGHLYAVQTIEFVPGNSGVSTITLIRLA